MIVQNMIAMLLTASLLFSISLARAPFRNTIGVRTRKGL